MLGNMYPFWAAITANLLTQGLKPLSFIKTPVSGIQNSSLKAEVFRSSHTSTVVGAGLSRRPTGTFLIDRLCAVAALFALIVMYDAANVRYYAGTKHPDHPTTDP